MNKDQIGIDYDGIAGFPAGKICMDCAMKGEEEYEGEYDTDSGRQTHPIYETFVCALCGEEKNET